MEWDRSVVGWDDHGAR